MQPPAPGAEPGSLCCSCSVHSSFWWTWKWFFWSKIEAVVEMDVIRTHCPRPVWRGGAHRTGFLCSVVKSPLLRTQSDPAAGAQQGPGVVLGRRAHGSRSVHVGHAFLLVCFQLKEKSQACGGNLGSIEELRGAIYLAEEACPGISDTMVAQLVQRLQR